jgi:hypothetical protein
MMSEPLKLDGPGTIRWAAGQPGGPRSMTWLVTANKNSDEVYLGARGLMKDMKLSLHASDIWRLALTDPTKYVPVGEDRVIDRWTPPPEFATGWRRAAVIYTPSTTFAAPYNEPRPSDGVPIRWFAAPDRPYHLQFQVLLGDAGAPDATLEDALEVGRMTLTSGRQVRVVGAVITLSANLEQQIETARARASVDPKAAAGFGSGRWGDGTPLFVDLANARNDTAGDSGPDGGDANDK